MTLKEMIDSIKRHEFRIDKNRINPFYVSYLDVFQSCSEAPGKFIITVIFTALGSAISSNRWIQWGTKQMFANFWVLILGESTRSRKSTSLNIGLYPVKKIAEQNPDRHLILPSRSSMAALLEALKTEKQGVIEHSEIATFLELLKKGFNVDMKSLLTTFFDVPASYKANFITKEDMILEKPIFSLATASTPVWLKENLKKGDATSGFLGRFIMAIQREKDRCIPIPQQPDQTRVQAIIDNFKSIYALKPAEITLGPGFKSVYSEFYHECDKFIKELPYDNGLNSLLSRLQTDYFLKFTILECVLSNKTEAGAEEAKRAKYLVAYYMTQAILTIKNITPNSQMVLEKKVLDFIRSSKEGVTRTDLHNLFNHNYTAAKLNFILSSLIKAELIEEVKVGGKGKRVYRLTS